MTFYWFIIFCFFQSRHFLTDKRKYHQLADPLLQGRYPLRPFQQLIAVILTCLQEHPRVRPVMADVVVALDYVASQPYVSEPDPEKISPPPASPSVTPSRDCITRRGLSFGRMWLVIHHRYRLRVDSGKISHKLYAFRSLSHTDDNNSYQRMY